LTRVRIIGLASGIVIGLIVVAAIGRNEATSNAERDADDDATASQGPTAAGAVSAPLARRALPPAVTVGDEPGGDRQPIAVRNVTAPGRDAHQAMEAAMSAHDPQLRARIAGALDRAVLSRATGVCGRDQARRRGRSWVLAGVLVLDLEIQADEARITELLFPGGDEMVVGDSTFQACVHHAVVGGRLPCPGCKPGTVTTPYPVDLVPFAPTPLDPR
jgi:hypothetical protein